jgi:pullulanase
MDKLAAVLLLTAQGVPFLHAGQEFLRSKGGHHNSYNKPDALNMIRWQKKAENRDVFDYYRGLIALRRTHPLFRQENAKELRDSLKYFDENLHLPVPEGCLAFQLEDTAGQDEWSRALVLVNPQPQVHAFIIPVGTWQIYADAHRSAINPLGQYITTSEISVGPRSALLLGERRHK